MLTDLSQWHALATKRNTMNGWTLRDAFASDNTRVSSMTFEACGMRFDFSKNLVDAEAFELLQDLAAARNVSAGVTAMLSGAKINKTEKRSVLHTALRRPVSDSLIVDGVDVVADVHEVLTSMRTFAHKVRRGEFVGSTGKPITRVINIGIGGSDLGPVMAYEALKSVSQRDLSLRFVSNVDGSDIAEALIDSDPETTLFIVASKTFTTAETMTNANTAKAWLVERLGSAFKPENHFVALSTNAKLVSDFGVAAENVFGFWDWVGGRFSMDSAIGLSTMIAIGPDKFDELLQGFSDMDRYLVDEPAESNVIYIMALLTVWYRNFFGAQSHAVLPYDNYLKRFPAYLQQLLMESNGKSVTLDGLQVETDTSPVYWGEPGTNGQHSFHQLLHQGTTMVPVDFFVAVKPVHELGIHHDLLFSNVLAQASVLAFGKNADEVRADGTAEELVTHKVMPGNRPSTLVIYEQLTPRVLGSLIALYEHITLIQGLIWGVGSFDQWGVELG
ncbi:MAG: hypothetical protein RL441_1312, partial [Actinomycetota bacterium]